MADGGDVGGRPVVAEFRLRGEEVRDAGPGAAHHVFEPGADEVDLRAALQELLAHVDRELPPGHPFERAGDRVVAPFAPAPFHQPERDVGEVLHPFEIADDHPAGIDVEVRQDRHAPAAQDPVRLEADGSVGRLDDEMGADARRVSRVDGILDRGGHEDVAGLLDARQAALEGARTGKAEDASGPLEVGLERLDGDPLGIGDVAVPLRDDGDPRAILLREELRGVIADIAEPLDRDRKPRQLAHPPDPRRAGVAQEAVQRVLDAAPRRFRPPRDAALRQRLAGDAGARVDDVGRIGTAELVDHPRHFALPGADVRRGNVDARADQAPLGEFLGEAPGDALELVRLPLPRLDLERALGPAERHVHQRALERHQRGERLDLVGIGVGREADAALDRFQVLAVHRAPADEAVHAPAKAHAEPDGVGRVALDDALGEPFRQLQEAEGVAEVLVDALEEGGSDGAHGFSRDGRCRMAGLRCGAATAPASGAKRGGPPGVEGRRPAQAGQSLATRRARTRRPGGRQPSRLP